MYMTLLLYVYTYSSRQAIKSASLSLASGSVTEPTLEDINMHIIL